MMAKVLPFGRKEPTEAAAVEDTRRDRPAVVRGIDYLRWQAYARWRAKMLAQKAAHRQRDDGGRQDG